MSLSRLLLQNFTPALGQLKLKVGTIEINVDKPPSHCAQLTVMIGPHRPSTSRAAKTDRRNSNIIQPARPARCNSSMESSQTAKVPTCPRIRKVHVQGPIPPAVRRICDRPAATTPWHRHHRSHGSAPSL